MIYSSGVLLCIIACILSVAAVNAPIGDVISDGKLWKQIFKEDFTTDAALGKFPASYPRWNNYGPGWDDTAHQAIYDSTKTVSVANGICDIYLHTENNIRYSAAILPNIDGQTYGRYEERFRADAADGWGLVWLLWPTSQVWPQDGEVDYPEGATADSPVHGYLHWANAQGQNTQSVINPGVDMNSWHVWAIEWSPNKLVYYVDGKVVGTSTSNVPSKPMFYVLQSGSAGGAIPATSTAHIQIDYVTVYSYGGASTATTTTTKAPTTTTKAPTTKAPTTKAGTTKAPTTKAPTTTIKGATTTTKAPTTKAPTTTASVSTCAQKSQIADFKTNTMWDIATWTVIDDTYMSPNNVAINNGGVITLASSAAGCPSACGARQSIGGAISSNTSFTYGQVDFLLMVDANTHTSVAWGEYLGWYHIQFTIQSDTLIFSALRAGVSTVIGTYPVAGSSTSGHWYSIVWNNNGQITVYYDGARLGSVTATDLNPGAVILTLSSPGKAAAGTINVYRFQYFPPGCQSLGTVGGGNGVPEYQGPQINVTSSEEETTSSTEQSSSEDIVTPTNAPVFTTSPISGTTAAPTDAPTDAATDAPTDAATDAATTPAAATTKAPSTVAPTAAATTPAAAVTTSAINSLVNSGNVVSIVGFVSVLAIAALLM